MSAPLNFMVKRGTTQNSILLRFQNQISFVPQTSLTAATAGLIVKYYRVGDGTADVSIACTSLATLSSSWTSGGFATINNGFVRLDVPDAAFADSPNLTGTSARVNQVLVFAEATGVISPGAMIQLIDGDTIMGTTPKKY